MPTVRGRIPRRLIIAALFCLGTAGCTDDSISQEFSLDSCQSVELRGDLEVSWLTESSSAMTAAIRADASTLAELSITQEPLVIALPAGFAEVSLQCGCPEQLKLLGSVALVADCPLADVRLYGSSAARLRGSDFRGLEVRTSGSAQLIVAEIDTDRLLVAAGGESRMVLSGNAAQFDLSTMGSAEVDGAELVVQSASVRARGMSRVHVAPTAHLYLDAESSSEVLYTTDPDLTVADEEGG